MSGSKESVESEAVITATKKDEASKEVESDDVSASAAAGLEKPPPPPPLSKLAATMPLPAAATNLRAIRSHPNMAAKATSRPATTSSLKTLSAAASLTSNISSSGGVGGGAGSADRQSTPSNADVDEVLGEDEGGHDTITSLAGAKMLQKYSRYQESDQKLLK